MNDAAPAPGGYLQLSEEARQISGSSVPTNAKRVGGTLCCLARRARSLHRRYKWALSKRHPHESNARQNGSVRAANKTEARKRTTTTSSQLDGTRIRCGCHEYRNAIQVPANNE